MRILSAAVIAAFFTAGSLAAYAQLRLPPLLRLRRRLPR